MFRHKRFSLLAMSAVLAFAVTSCHKEGSQPSTVKDSNASASARQYMPDTTPQQQITARIADSNDPVAKKLVEDMKRRLSEDEVATRKGTTRKLDPAQLARLQPKLPGYTMEGAPKPGQSHKAARSTATFVSKSDPGSKVFVTIMDLNDQLPSPYHQVVEDVRKTGSKELPASVGGGTAYYLQVDNASAVKTYVPQKKIATLTILAGTHRAVLLREEGAKSADHLVELAKKINIHGLEQM